MLLNNNQSQNTNNIQLCGHFPNLIIVTYGRIDGALYQAFSFAFLFVVIYAIYLFSHSLPGVSISSPLYHMKWLSSPSACILCVCAFCNFLLLLIDSTLVSILFTHPIIHIEPLGLCFKSLSLRPTQIPCILNQES